MQILLQILLIGVASNIDNLAVGVTYGIRRISISTLPNLLIAVMAFVFSSMGSETGAQMGRYLPPRVADMLGAYIIIGIGCWVLPLRKRKKPTPPPSSDNRLSARRIFMRLLREPELADRDHSLDISIRESLLLGAALSLNCFTNGVPAGLWKLNVWRVASCNAVMSFAALWLGVWFGKRHGAHWLGNKADIVAGLLLILLGLHEVCWG